MAFLIAVLSAFAWAEDGKTLVVSPAGNDGAAGTREAPLKTIAAALGKVGPGDKVVVLEGTYSETVTLPKSGEANKPIALSAEGKVVLSPSRGKDLGHGIVGRGVGHWLVEGFEIVRAQQGIKFKDGHDIVVRKCQVRDSDGGLALEGAKAERMVFEDIELTNGVYGGVDVGNPVAMEDVAFRRVSAHHNGCKEGSDGFGISHGCTTKNVVFEKCEAYENGSDGFDLSGRKGYGVTAVDCVSHHNGTKIWGANFKCWNPKSKFINCVAYATGKENDGNFESPADDTTYINCTSGENGDSGFAASGKNVRLINCIIAGAKKLALKAKAKDGKLPAPIAENCLVFNCGDNALIDVGKNGNLSGDPLFVDTAKGDYHIKPGSAAAGKGKPSEAAKDAAGKDRPKDAPSIGAFEP
jgi:hypothetical protein